MFGTNKTLRNCPTSIKEEEIHLKTRERRRNPSEKPTSPSSPPFLASRMLFYTFFLGGGGSIRTRSSFIILNWYHPRSNALKSESQKTWERSEPRAGGSGVRTLPLCYNRCQLIKSWFEIACWGHSVWPRIFFKAILPNCFLCPFLHKSLTLRAKLKWRRIWPQGRSWKHKSIINRIKVYITTY